MIFAVLVVRCSFVMWNREFLQRFPYEKNDFVKVFKNLTTPKRKISSIQRNVSLLKDLWLKNKILLFERHFFDLNITFLNQTIFFSGCRYIDLKIFWTFQIIM